jgi:hypothetical protein
VKSPQHSFFRSFGAVMPHETDTKVIIGGVPVTIVSDDQAETADYVVCVSWSTPSIFSNDQRATCCACGVAVRHRPYIPKKPAKLCMECCLKMAKAN